MRDDSREIELKLDRILCVVIGAKVAAIFPPRIDVRICVTRATLLTAFSRAFWIRELRHTRAQIIHRHFIERKHARERAPFGGHVGDGHARRHRKTCHAVADKLDGVIEHLVFVKEAAQRDDHILADDARRKFSLEHNLRDRWNLPPGNSCRPDARRICAHDRRTKRGHCTVQI